MPRSIATGRGVVGQRNLIFDVPYSIEFDGINDYMTVLDSASLNAACGAGQARSFGFWIHTYERGNKVIMEKGSNMLHVGAQTIAQGFAMGVQGSVANNINPIVDGVNVWHHLVCTMDSGSTGTVYMDGAFINSEAGWTGLADNNENLQFGRTTGQVFAGTLTLPFVYNRDLTADEILVMYQDNIYPTSGLQMLLGMAEGSGATVADLSGNGNTGTLTGALWSTDVPRKLRGIAGVRGVV